MSVVIRAVASPTPPNSDATVIANSQLARSLMKTAIALADDVDSVGRRDRRHDPDPGLGKRGEHRAQPLRVGLANHAHEAHVAGGVAQALERLQELGLVGQRGWHARAPTRPSRKVMSKSAIAVAAP